MPRISADDASSTPCAAAVLGADLAGVTAGGAIGGAAGFGYADLGSNGITLVADLAEQNMAQVRLGIPSPCQGGFCNGGNHQLTWAAGALCKLHALSSAQT